MDDLEPFFLDLGGDRFRATGRTVGPWDPGQQHGGPPSALLGRALERFDQDPDSFLGRICLDFLAPVPVAELSVRVRPLREGRSVKLLEAELVTADERVCLRATAWRLRTAEIGVDVGAGARPASIPPPDDRGIGGFGYAEAMQWRFVEGRFGRPGPAVCWTRTDHPLVDGEKPTGIQRVLLSADSGSGISHELRWDTHIFTNIDLTVHLVREPVSPWIRLDSHTSIASHGVGLANTVISDEQGPIGTGAQTLFVRPVPSGR